MEEIEAGKTTFIHESAYVDEGCKLGERVKVWHFSHIMGKAIIGDDCVIGQNVFIADDVIVGIGCKIQNNVSLYAGLRLGDYVFCGPSCVFTNVINPRADVDRKQEFRLTKIGLGATIGANATVICGNKIGKYAFIAAGAVVTRPVADFALMKGMPARRVGWISRAGSILKKDLICHPTGVRYKQIAENLLIET